MHLVIGDNHDRFKDQHLHCWTSPVALSTIASLHEQSAYLAFYIFRVDAFTPAHTALADILSQLLEAKRLGLCDNSSFSTVRAWVEKMAEVCRSDDEIDKLDALIDMASRMMSLYQPEDVVYIVLDRVDRCCTSGQLEMLKGLVRMMDQASCTMKVLIVAEGTFWNVKVSKLKAVAKSQRVSVTGAVEQQAFQGML